MTGKPKDHPQAKTPKEREAEYEAIGAAVLVEYVRDDVKARVETLRARLHRSLGKPYERR